MEIHKIETVTLRETKQSQESWLFTNGIKDINLCQDRRKEKHKRAVLGMKKGI